MAQLSVLFVSPNGRELPALIHLPVDHGTRPRKRWPFVLNLHGGGERGADPRALLKNDPARRLEHAPRFPFVVVSPQCPRGTTWAALVPTLLALLDEMVPLLRGNPRRVHVTGASMGGSGTWVLAAADPHRFASAVPVCASIPHGHDWPARAGRLGKTSVWAFHGSRDPVIPLRHPRALRSAHRAGGGRSRLTVLKGVGHVAWTPAYANPRLWTWISNRRRPA